MRQICVTIVSLIVGVSAVHAADVFVEAESFENKGGWMVDQQFMDIMGSPYLIAHGMGTPVADASQQVNFQTPGTYYVFVRTFNWTSPWKKGKGPGKFTVTVGKKKLPVIAGCEGYKWMWQYIGSVCVKDLQTQISLNDLTGFDGRCDAIYFSTNKVAPPAEMSSLEKFRREKTGLAAISPQTEHFDFVVAGAGIAGICAAVSAAREGLKVALVSDRPVLGGNNSSEIRVHLGGLIELEPYENIGNLIKEFGPTKFGNAMPAANYGDDKKMNFVRQEKNITLFTNTHIISAKTSDNTIEEIVGQNIETGKRVCLQAPLFADCTGDGAVGALAGAEYMMGREAKSAFGENLAINQADKLTMGASVQWYATKSDKPVDFPLFEYGVQFNEKNKKSITKGDWDWETGMNHNQIKDAEYVRDYGLNVVYSIWSFLKNRSKDKEKFANEQLTWVAYIAGKRESRRLTGDYVLTGTDLTKHQVYPDGTACASWSIDLHLPEAQNSKYFPGHEFISKDYHTKILAYPVPYRCLYSRNINNLFMAGRDISVTHVALGSVRVMRTGGMLGEVVGMAAAVCHKHNASPRQVYSTYFSELQELMKVGTGKHGLPNNQEYNPGAKRIKLNKNVSVDK
jgi:hypothetical protein